MASWSLFSDVLFRFLIDIITEFSMWNIYAVFVLSVLIYSVLIKTIWLEIYFLEELQWHVQLFALYSSLFLSIIHDLGTGITS